MPLQPSTIEAMKDHGFRAGWLTAEIKACRSTMKAALAACPRKRADLRTELLDKIKDCNETLEAIALADANSPG
jgi:hypothetical protein